MKPIKSFYINSPGERAAGISSTSAEVQFPIDFDDKEYVEFVREQLKVAFCVIMDDDRVTVMTDVEVAEMNEGERNEPF